MLRIIRISSLLLLALVAGIWGYAWTTKGPNETLGEAFAARLAGVFGQEMAVPSAGGGGMQMPGGISLGGAFELVDQTGKAVTERDYAGRWLLVYFGFTYCPDICPTELGTMAAAIDLLGPEGEAVTPLLITIDPARDTPAALADYVPRFHPRLQGLTGTPEQIAAVARRYRVYYARAQRPDMTDYLMDHSSFIYLVGPDGRVRSLFRPEMTPEQIAAAVGGQMRAAVRAGS
ncbi:SCO family protein [Roseococcus sp.]|uniref:SCO family protein n=1 Tax=Roseococcus sp. TaxID=2109646 RepID=UPI003BA89814